MIHKYPLLSSANLLKRYLSGNGFSISASEILDEVFVNAWKGDGSVPDNQIKNILDKHVGPVASVGEYLKASLDTLTADYLTYSGETIYVEKEKFFEWQDVITANSPLLLVAYFMSAGNTHFPLQRLVTANIAPNPLPHYHSPALEKTLADVGLVDLHVHLNGASLADAIWEFALRDPLAFRRQMREEHRRDSHTHEEFFAQYCSFLRWEDVPTLVDIAACLRDWLARWLVSCAPGASCMPCGLRPSSAAGARRVSSPGDACRGGCKQKAAGADDPACHWFRHLHGTRPLETLTLGTPPMAFFTGRHPVRWYAPQWVCWCNEAYVLQDEAVFLVSMFNTIAKFPIKYVEHCLFYYILLKNFFRQLLVQQCMQIGFDQFQKITLTGIRERYEKQYAYRFLQFDDCKNNGCKLHVEGRFSPKKQYYELLDFIRQIDNGFRKYTSIKRKYAATNNCAGTHGYKESKDVQNTVITVSLVAHFIKRKDDVRVTGCQYYMLRRDIMAKARALVAYLENMQHEPCADSDLFRPEPPMLRVVGFDAAANELHAPPEVFAPVFRYLRHHGQRNFTFHAGEDFQHLVSGVRAVDEAIVFLRLNSGCRIGHGTALGIDPGLWRRQIGARVTLRKQEWLDTMVYAAHHLRGKDAFNRETQAMERDIPQLAMEVYGKAYDPQLLFSSWQCRDLDPLTAFFDGTSMIADDFYREEYVKICDVKRKLQDAYDIFQTYHYMPAIGCMDLEKAFEKYKDYNIEYRKIVSHMSRISGIRSLYITVPTDYFSDEAMRFLQALVMKKMKSKNIALEVMLTSNVRISFYRQYAEHHILRWLGVNPRYADEAHPNVCLGTDNPGIFATTAKNEYFHLASMLESAGVADARLQGVIAAVVNSSRAYSFQ